MSSITFSASSTPRVAFNRLLWVGPLVILAGIVANTLVQWLAVSILQPDPMFLPLTGFVPAFFTFFALLAAVIVFAVIGLISQEPIKLFTRVALVALILSFIPDVLMLVLGSNPGTTVGTVLALMLMHVVTWAIAVYGLTNFARA